MQREKYSESPQRGGSDTKSPKPGESKSSKGKIMMGDDNEAKFWPLVQVGIIPKRFPWRQRYWVEVGKWGGKK